MTKGAAQSDVVQTRANDAGAGRVDWHKAISNHVAFALLTYTGLHIVVTMSVVKAGQGALLPYFALIVLVAAIIPACRWLEKRWEDLGDEVARDPAHDLTLARMFRRDVIMLWAGAIGLPFMMTGICKATRFILQ